MTELRLDVVDPRRGEVWLVDFETSGIGITRTYPAVVVSSDTIGDLSIRLIAPITDWQVHFIQDFWRLRLEPDELSGLKKVSAVDVLQLQGASVERFMGKLGVVSAAFMDEIVRTIAAVIEYQHPPS